ncbi:cytochrome c553 [mine drainage metagenome]|uniref:Cytochrome c553 n=1 Tax=mine drainage metagenome TaxID=410659 RepID=T1C8Y5_9ZZZZ
MPLLRIFLLCAVPGLLMLLLGACSERMPRSSGRAMLAPAGMQPPAQLGLCAACHGANGHARQPDIPDLAGQKADYLFKAMRDYQSGARNVPLMRGALGSIDVRQMRALADWYAAQPACAPQVRRP